MMLTSLYCTWCLYTMRATTWKSIGNLTGQTLSDRQRKTRASLLLLHSFLPLHFALITFVMNRRTGRERGLPLLKQKRLSTFRAKRFFLYLHMSIIDYIDTPFSNPLLLPRFYHNYQVERHHERERETQCRQAGPGTLGNFTWKFRSNVRERRRSDVPIQHGRYFLRVFRKK